MKVSLLLLGFLVVMTMAQKEGGRRGGGRGRGRGGGGGEDSNSRRERMLKLAEHLSTDILETFKEELTSGDDQIIQDFKELAGRLLENEQNETK